MPAFFETMSRHAGGSETNIPEMLRTHPVTSTRIAETKERAAQLDVKADPDSPSYALTRERLRVLWSGANMSNESLLQHLKDWIAQAESSGIKVLQDFAASLRGYAVQPA